MYKPTAEEKRIIRECAQKSSGFKRVLIEPGERCRLDNQKPDATEMNIRLLTEEEHWDDTDLFQQVPWKHFTRGFELTPDGRAVIDFYVYSTGRNGELETNVVAYWENSKLVRVRGVFEEILWEHKASS